MWRNLIKPSKEARHQRSHSVQSHLQKTSGKDKSNGFLGYREVAIRSDCQWDRGCLWGIKQCAGIDERQQLQNCRPQDHAIYNDNKVRARSWN